MNDLLDLPPIVDDFAEVASEVVDSAEIRNGKALVRYTRTEAALADLKARFTGATYDLKTTAGDKAARAARLELTTLRTDLERKRKAFKEPALEFGRLIDSEAKRITGEIVKLEEPIDAQIKADEARRAAEKAERERIERERVERLQAGVAKIRGYVQQAAGLPAERIAKFVTALDTMAFVPESWQEFAAQATAARDESLAALRLMHAAAVQAEADRAERERLEAEAARLRAEAAERDRIEEARIEHERQALRREEEEAALIAGVRTRELLAQRAERIAEQVAATGCRYADWPRPHIKALQDTLLKDAPATVTTPGGIVADASTGEVLQSPEPPAPAREAAAIAMLKALEEAATPPMKLGDINARLGITMTEAFVRDTLGITPMESKGRAVLIASADWPRLKAALVKHIEAA